jgi:hypothetical protein
MLQADLDRPRPPTPLLLDLAAGREPTATDLERGEPALALDHRMAGLLWSWGRGRALSVERRTWLVKFDLGVHAHLDHLWRVLEEVTARLGEADLEVATLKGVLTGARWYERPSERPCSDIDLWLSPAQLHRASEAAALIQPDHPWVPHLDALVASGRLQAVTLSVADVDIDLHFDPMKLGIPTRGLAELWDRTVVVSTPSGGSLRTLDDTATLLHFLLHLNKDRFQRLLGYADVVRVARSRDVDWDLLRRDARREGVEFAVLSTLAAVAEDLGTPPLGPVPRPRGPRALLWRLLWRRRIRLRGSEGRLRFRMRQNWLALLAEGRGLEAVVWWLAELWPPAAAVEVRYGPKRGPYLYRLLIGRLAAARDQRRDLARVRRRAARVTETRPAGVRPASDPSIRSGVDHACSRE